MDTPLTTVLVHRNGPPLPWDNDMPHASERRALGRVHVA